MQWIIRMCGMGVGRNLGHPARDLVLWASAICVPGTVRSLNLAGGQVAAGAVELPQRRRLPVLAYKP